MNIDDRFRRATDGMQETGSTFAKTAKRRLASGAGRLMLIVFGVGFVLFVLFKIGTRNVEAAEGHRVYVLMELARPDGTAFACEPGTDWQDELIAAGSLDEDAFAVCGPSPGADVEP